MAKSRQTLDDLLRPILDADRLTSWCLDVARIRPWTLFRLRRGEGRRVNRGTVLAIMTGLEAEGIRVTEKRIRDAISESRSTGSVA